MTPTETIRRSTPISPNPYAPVKWFVTASLCGSLTETARLLQNVRSVFSRRSTTRANLELELSREYTKKTSPQRLYCYRYQLIAHRFFFRFLTNL